MRRFGIFATLFWAVLAGCSGAPAASDSNRPSPSPAMSTAATPSPAASLIGAATPSVALPSPSAEPTTTYWAKDPPEPLLLGSAVAVVVPELNIRERPTTSAARVDTFRSGQVILVRELIPPVEADGYIWYEGYGPYGDGKGGLLPLPHDPYAGSDATGGWFAAIKGATAYVAPVRPRCPSVPDLRHLGAMLPAERLACLGNRTIQFDASFRPGCPTCEYYGTFEPGWLADANELNLAKDTQSGLGLDLRFRPGMDRPQAGMLITVEGHFDDPAAVDCSMALVPSDYSDMELDPVPASVAELWCRQMFVVERYEVLGPDPSFNPDEPF